MRQVVVLIHGIWMNGWEMLYLRRRLQGCGFVCHRYHYQSLVQTPQVSAAQLAAFVKTIEADIVHIVAHSSRSSPAARDQCRTSRHSPGGKTGLPPQTPA